LSISELISSHLR